MERWDGRVVESGDAKWVEKSEFGMRGTREGPMRCEGVGKGGCIYYGI